MTLARLAIVATLALLGNVALATTYRFDTAHSQILASADHNGYSKPVGRLHIAGGWLSLDGDDWRHAATVVDIDLASVDFGDAAWNQALRGAAWLDVGGARYAHFESTHVTPEGADVGIAHGKLTLRGVTQPLDLRFRLNRRAWTLFDMNQVVGFSAGASFDRRAFGLRDNAGSVGTRVTLRLEIEAIRDDNAMRDYRHPKTDVTRSKP